MITIIQPRSRSGKKKKEAHPEWESWMEACSYTHEVARHELQMANGTFYRQIRQAPDFVTRLAMAALYEGIAPFGPT